MCGGQLLMHHYCPWLAEPVELCKKGVPREESWRGSRDSRGSQWLEPDGEGGPQRNKWSLFRVLEALNWQILSAARSSREINHSIYSRCDGPFQMMNAYSR